MRYVIFYEDSDGEVTGVNAPSEAAAEKIWAAAEAHGWPVLNASLTPLQTPAEFHATIAAEDAAGKAAEHDAKCESLPGGEYEGKTIGGDATRAPMPVPCHCAARAAGRAAAERELGP